MVEAVHRAVALQTQEPASSYLALWNRVEAFDPAALDRAYVDHAIVRATLMRVALHAVDAADYPVFHEAMQPRLRAARLPRSSLYRRRPIQRGRGCARPRSAGVRGTTSDERRGRVVVGRAVRCAVQAGRVVGAADVCAARASAGHWTVVVRSEVGLCRGARSATLRRPGPVSATAGPPLPRGVRPGLGPGRRSIHLGPAGEGAPRAAGPSRNGREIRRPRRHRVVRCPGRPSAA